MSQDPWAFQRWAHGVKTGSIPRKSVLLMLSTMVDSTTGRCEAKQEMLAAAIEGSERTARAALQHLEDAGVIARRPQRRLDGSRRNDEILLLAPWVEEWPDGEALPTRPEPPAPDAGAGTGATENQPAGDAGCTNRHLTTDQPASDDQTNRQEMPVRNVPPLRGGTTENLPSGAKENAALKEARAREKAQRLPEDFPDELVEHARLVFSLLRSVAEQHNARLVTPRAVGLTIQGAPGRRHVQEARSLAAWAQSAPRQIKDVVATYRSWLERSEVYAGIEALTPPATTAVQAGNAFGRADGGSRIHPADQRDAQLAAMAEEARRRGE